jgi:hypothetical protein
MKFLTALFVGLLVAPLVGATDVGLQNCWLAWTPSPSDNVVAYHLKLAPTTGGPYSLRQTRVDLADIELSTQTPGDLVVDCNVAGLSVSDVTGSKFDYYVVVTAENVVGDESGPSNEVLARLHVPPGNPGNARVTKTRP